MDTDKITKLFNNLLAQAEKKSEKKVYTTFTGILASLESKDLTEQQSQKIQEKLSSMNLETAPENKRKFYTKKLIDFKTFLKSEFSFTTEKHYSELYMVYGLSIGTAMGVSIGVAIDPKLGTSIGISMGVAIGMVLGMAFGAQKDAEAKKQGKVV